MPAKFLVQAQAEAKGLTFTSRFEGEVPSVVRGDPLRVCQVLHNLLSNAVKFTDAGEILYVVRGTRLADDRVRFDFAVTDSGAGIAPVDLERLFQPFTQVDASSTRRFGGTGLGLRKPNMLLRCIILIIRTGQPPARPNPLQRSF